MLYFKLFLIVFMLFFTLTVKKSTFVALKQHFGGKCSLKGTFSAFVEICCTVNYRFRVNFKNFRICQNYNPNIEQEFPHLSKL
jgi:hypothetical protein